MSESQTASRLKYLRSMELRFEIACLVGIDETERYRGGQAGFQKRHLYQIAKCLGEPPEDMTLTDLYEWINEQVGTEYRGNSGSDWRLRRPTLKAIHAELTHLEEQ